MKQKKLFLSFKSLFIAIFMLLNFEISLFSAPIYYDRFDYPYLFHKILDDRHSEIYKISIKDVTNYLPYEQTIKKPSVKLLDEQLLPLKAMVKIMYRGFHKKKNHLLLTPRSFFDSLSEDVPYTYVIKDNQLIVAQSTQLSISEKWRDRFSKHYFISGLKNHVRYAGEFYIVKNIKDNQIAVVFDNASGTFCPESSYLPSVKALMTHNFSQENLHFIVKKHNEKIDIQEVFNYFEPSSQQSL